MFILFTNLFLARPFRLENTLECYNLRGGQGGSTEVMKYKSVQSTIMFWGAQNEQVVCTYGCPIEEVFPTLKSFKCTEIYLVCENICTLRRKVVIPNIYIIRKFRILNFRPWLSTELTNSCDDHAGHVSWLCTCVLWLLTRLNVAFAVGEC